MKTIMTTTSVSLIMPEFEHFEGPTDFAIHEIAGCLKYVTYHLNQTRMRLKEVFDQYVIPLDASNQDQAWVLDQVNKQLTQIQVQLGTLDDQIIKLETKQMMADQNLQQTVIELQSKYEDLLMMLDNHHHLPTTQTPPTMPPLLDPSTKKPYTVQYWLTEIPDAELMCLDIKTLKRLRQNITANKSRRKREHQPGLDHCQVNIDKINAVIKSKTHHDER